ncbi:MAG TPA: DUF3224 domain-containing protein [Gemmatimonadaceae bacterium]|nr:DUF3224 domain-containing protein [Gemmatimonadaceae bacterium]
MKVHGTFDVKLTTETDAHLASTPMLARRLIAKQFHGGLEATSIGEMLSAGTATQGSAAYSAIEQVTGSLAGRRGTFALQHTGIMHRGAASLTITVVPDSGTGELEGLTGTMAITIENGGGHVYDLEYQIAES